jgi:hypothetical protein
MDNTNPLSQDPQQQVYNPLKFNDDVMQISDPLDLKIDDEELIKIINQRIKDSETFYEQRYDLKNRRKQNETYLFGRQLAQKEKTGKLKDYESRSSDNALYEIEASLEPLAMSKLPDIIVSAGDEEDQNKKESAKSLSIAIDDMNKKREQRMVLALGFKHLPVYFTGIIKTRWDASKGKNGDFVFEIIPPEYIVVDHNAQSKNPDDMSFIAQCVPMTAQDMIMRFPDKKQEIYEELGRMGIMVGAEPTWKDLASEVKIYEVWFDWYQKKGSKEVLSKPDPNVFEPGVEWEQVHGVMWKFNNLLLKKMLDPNYDHEGEDKMFMYQTPGDESTKQEVPPQIMLMSALTGQQIPGLVKEKVFHNYFDRCHKPFYFFGYDQWGKIAYDETSRIEQNIHNQENLDDQNKSILDQIKTRVKHIWSKDSGMRSGDVQKLDLDDPKMDALVEGDPNKVHSEVRPERPDASQFNALNDTRSRMYAISGSTAVRGSMQSDVATTNQIAREADFTRADSLVENTINAASEWMAQWQMQWIMLRYTESHLTQILGSKGAVTYLRLRRDMVSDGMEVMVKSSSTDKLKAQRNAMDTAKLGPPFTNPIDFFNDMDMSDPEGRAERGFLFSNDPATYFTKYILGLENTQQQVGALGAGQPPTTSPQPSQPAQTPPGAPQAPTPVNTSNVPSQPPVGVPASGGGIM